MDNYSDLDFINMIFVFVLNLKIPLNTIENSVQPAYILLRPLVFQKHLFM